MLTRIELPVLSLLVNAGCNVRTTASCDTDVGDVGVAVLDELVDKPGQRVVRSFPCCTLPVSIFDKLWFLATGLLVGVSVIFAEFPNERTANVSSRSFTVTSKSNV